jgi:ankyrin repeat protein
MRGVSILCRKNYPIRWAARNGHLEAVKFFKEKGAVISAQRNYAIRHAAWGGHVEVVKYLHQNNADITAVNNFAIKVAIEYKYLDIIKYLHDVGVDLTDPSFISKAAGKEEEEDEECLEIITYLVVECGADVTVNNNETIRKVCEGECVKTAKYLIACGADITAKNNEAIHNAVDRSAIKMVEFLLSLNVYPTEMIRSIESYMDKIRNMLNTYTYFVMTKSAR